jgi:hypothetical protein
MKVALFSLTVTLVLSVSSAEAKDALEMTRQCMVKHGAKRQPDGGVFLSGPREQSEAIRAKCRKQSGYRD